MARHNELGDAGEHAVIKYLRSKKYKIVDKNWKTTKCEIDIIAKKDDCIYFVEVKYRSSDSQGSGFDYITPSKLKQMEYAAETWLQKNNWQDESCLSVAEVMGRDFKINFINQI